MRPIKVFDYYALLIGSFLLLVTSPSLAEEPARSGFFAGANIGSGLGTLSPQGSTETPLNGISKPGVDIGLEVGTSLDSRFFLSIEPNIWLGYGSDEAVTNAHQYYGLSIGTKYFVYEGIHLTGALGYSTGSFTALSPSIEGDSEKLESGLSYELGLGYEVLLEDNIALGFYTDMARHNYSTWYFDIWSSGFSLRWY
jgi:hypothetical protein